MKHFNFLATNLLLMVSALFFMACDDDAAAEFESSLNTLTNGSSKSWYLSTQTNEGDFISCSASSPQSEDNTFIFYADGTFIFDQGQITEDPDCTDEGCCQDHLSIKGTWKFTGNEEGVKVIASHVKDDPSSILNKIFFEIDIELLEDDKLILSDTELSFMFRPKQPEDSPCAPHARCPEN